MDRPLSSFERAMVRTHRHDPFNVVVHARLAGRVREPDLRGALDRLQARHPALRCAVRGRRRGLAFEPIVDAPLPLRCLGRRGEEAWRELVEEELGARLDLEAGPLARAALAGPDAAGRSDLVLTFFHGIADAPSIAALLCELLSAISGATLPEGEVAPLPLLEERFPPAHRGLGGRRRVLGALGRQMRDEVRFAVGARQRAPVDPAARCRVLILDLDAGETAALLGGVRRRRLTLNSVLNAAFATAVDERLRGGVGGPLRTFTMAGLRPQVVPELGASSLGAAWSMMRFLVVRAPGEDQWSLAARLQENFRAGLARGDKYTAYQTAEPMMRVLLATGWSRMSEIAVSFTGVAEVAPRYGELRVEELQAFVSTIDMGPLVVVQGRIWEGCLGCGIVYLDTDMTRDEAEGIAERARELLCDEAEGGT